MHRRQLLQGTAALTAATSIGLPVSASGAPLRMQFAPHFGQFAALAGEDPVAQLEWAKDQGFSAFEDNGMMGRPVEEQLRIGRALERLGMTMGVFVANFGTAFGKRSFASGAPEHRQSFLSDLTQAVEVAKRVGARWTTIVLGDRDPGSSSTTSTPTRSRC